MKNQALVCFAGAAAQRRFNVKGWRHYQARSDFESATSDLQYLVGSDKEHQALVNEIDSKAQKMIKDPFIWSCIERLAAALLKRHELSGKQAVQILRDHRSRPSNCGRV